MTQEEIIIDIKIENEQNEKEVNKLTSSIVNLTKANKDLIEENKKLEKAGQTNSKAYLENSKQIEVNKQKISENTASRKSLIQSIIAEDDSIKGLKLRNAELIKQRDQITTATEEGRQKIAAMNKEIDKNNAVITANRSQLEQQKDNIGNYKSALDDLIPGFQGMTNGIQTATKASMTLIATPLGAMLAAVALALSPLISYLTSTGDGMDYVEKKSAGLKNGIGALKDEFNSWGKAMFENKDGAAEFGKTLLSTNPIVATFLAQIELIKAAFPGMTKRFEDAQKAGEEYAETMDDINTKQRIFNIENAEAENEIKRLLLQAKDRTKSEEERIALIDQVMAKERELSDQRKSQARDELNATIGLAESRTEIVRGLSETDDEYVKRLIDNLDKTEGALADSLAEAAKKLKDAEGEGIATQEKAQNQRNALAEKQQENIDKEIAKQQALNEEVDKYIEKVTKGLITQNLTAEEFAAKEAERAELKKERDAEAEELSKGLTEGKIETQTILDNFDARIAQEQSDRSKKLAAEDLANTKATQAAQLASFQARGAAAGNLFALTSSLFKQESAEQKAFALLSIITNTGVGIANAVKAGSGLVWPANLVAIASGISAVLAGISQAKNVLKFAAGGLVPGYAGGGRHGRAPLSGTLIREGHGMPITRSNGDNRLATVKTGEVILNKRQQNALGGDATFRKIGVPGFASGGSTDGEIRTASTSAQKSLDINQLATLINRIQPVLVLEEFEAKQSSRDQLNTKASVI
jgi:hypothetical protein